MGGMPDMAASLIGIDKQEKKVRGLSVVMWLPAWFVDIREVL